MSLIALAVLVLCLYLAVKVVGFVFKFGLVIVALAVLYWLARPYIGAPALY